MNRVSPQPRRRPPLLPHRASARRLAWATGALVAVLVGGCGPAPSPPPGPGGATGGDGAGLTPWAPERLSEADYRRAEAFLGWNAVDQMTGGTAAAGQEHGIAPNWLGDGTDDFWYRVEVPGGHRFVRVDPVARTRRPAFDHAAVAQAYNDAAGDSVGPLQLPFDAFTYLPGDSIAFTESGFNIAFRCPASSVEDPSCAFRPFAPPNRLVAPRTGYGLELHGHDLWRIRPASDSLPADTLRLTSDGAVRHGWGTIPDECCDAVQQAMYQVDSLPVGAWSPDGTRVVTHRYDERGVGELHLLETRTGRPVLHSYPYALPGDTAFPRYTLHVFDGGTGARVDLDTAPMLDGFAAETFPVQWSSDGGEIYFTRHDLGYRTVELVFANPATGATRTVIRETDSTFVDLNQIFPFQPPNWRVVRGGDAVVWWSERSGWGHLYLYELDHAGGTVSDPRPITTGEWMVLDVVHVDEGDEWIYFTALGREAGVDPYLPQLYRVRFDGSSLARLTPEPADHDVHVSPSGRFIVDTRSTRTDPGVSVLRSSSGEVLMELERMEISPLMDQGWQLPVHFTAAAADGETELHGFLHFPSHFDPAYRYPVVDFVYPGPQIGPILTRSFTVTPFGDPHALAELGFIVFTVDARGTPQRSKDFHDHDYGRLGEYSLHDHMAALRELAGRIPQMDLDRVGIMGHSGGGAAAAAALLRHGDFYRVGVAGAGNHDNRSYFFPWGHRYQGTDLGTYADQASQNHADSLTGRLLLTWGTMDDNVHPNGTLLLVDSLIAANRDFDLLAMPNRTHEYMSEPYAIRRGWDYLVEHLLGAMPPTRYRITPPAGQSRGATQRR